MAHTRIKEILSQKGIKIKDLCENLGMSQPYVSNILSDKGNPTLNTLLKIAEFLQVPVEDLFGDPSMRAHCPHCGKTVKIVLSKD